MIKREIINELHGPSPKNYHRRRVITRGNKDLRQWGAFQNHMMGTDTC